MSLVFFVSSMGDTDLASATINKLIEYETKIPIFLIPLTSVAEKNTEKFAQSKQVTRLTLDKIIQNSSHQPPKQFTEEELQKISLFIESNKIQRAFIGVPSPLKENLPFQIAQSLAIPCTVAYEYMFTAPKQHCFWENINPLVAKGNCDFAVPFERASKEILELNDKAKVTSIGHCSIDRGLVNNDIDHTKTKKLLQISDNDELIFVSGTTQPTETDNQFLDALLQELNNGKYPTFQLRFGIHPGVNDLDAYLDSLLKTCAKYPATCTNFKIILTSQLEQRLQSKINETQGKFVLRAEVFGSQAAQAANRVSQAVPGALLNEAALKGKPSYFHDQSATPYLPEIWFAKSISLFFNTKQQTPHTREQLGLSEDTAAQMAKLLTIP